MRRAMFRVHGRQQKAAPQSIRGAVWIAQTASGQESVYGLRGGSLTCFQHLNQVKACKTIPEYRS